MNQRQLRARIVLDEARALGLDLSDLIAADTSSTALPTVGAYIAEIESTFTAATAATYRPYWRLVTDRLGERRLAEITVTDLAAVVDEAGARAARNRESSSGRASRETCVAAVRAVFGRAHAAGLTPIKASALLRKPRRVQSRRRALDDHELADLIDAVRTTSNDPDLDLLVIRFHLETGARREGALNLRRRDLDPARSTVWLREKGDSEREQPISPALIMLVHRRAEHRGAVRLDDLVLRTLSGTPFTARRYDTLFVRARSCLAWAERTPVSAHVLRHTAITAVGRHAGHPVAQAFAGHAPPLVTGRYLHASLAEVAAAVGALTGQPHPLARSRLSLAELDRHLLDA